MPCKSTWGSSGAGEDSKACKLSSAVFRVRAGLHWSFNMSRHMAPFALLIFGCLQFNVIVKTLKITIEFQEAHPGFAGQILNEPWCECKPSLPFQLFLLSISFLSISKDPH